MARDEKDYLSTDEVKAKLSCLSKADLLRLRRIAQYQASKLRGCEPDDLLSEGVNLVISGTRRWPRGIDIAPFMRNVFDSLVSSKAKHAAVVGRYEVDVEVDRSGNPDFGDHAAELDRSSDPSDRAYAQEVLEIVTNELSGDQHAQALALAMGEGLTAKETQTHFNMSQHQYDSARKRLRRVVSRLVVKEKAP